MGAGPTDRQPERPIAQNTPRVRPNIPTMMRPGVKRTSTPPVPSYYGWIVVAVVFVTMALGPNARTAFALPFPPILSERITPLGESKHKRNHQAET
jgi:hypothetical protein